MTFLNVTASNIQGGKEEIEERIDIYILEFLIIFSRIMDYLEQPEIKETYNKCKLIVKVWEHKFTKKYKRLPSKVSNKIYLSFISI